MKFIYRDLGTVFCSKIEYFSILYNYLPFFTLYKVDFNTLIFVSIVRFIL